MCACKPGATCNYHTYANWPQARKDAWNARRRARYAAKKAAESASSSTTSETHEASQSSPSVHRLELRDRAVLRGYHGQELSALNQHERAQLFAVIERAGYPEARSMRAEEFRERLLKLRSELDG